MKEVRIPKGASITMGRDDYRRATGAGSGWGWFIAFLIFLAVAFGSTDGTDTPKGGKTDTPRPTATATR